MTCRLAIIATHPIQYYAPWYRNIAEQPGLSAKVFYLWQPQGSALVDPGFGHRVEWDVPLLEGYGHEFVPNRSKTPGTSHFNGLDNPSLSDRLAEYAPDAILFTAYNYRSMYRVLFAPQWRSTPKLIRGDSHLIARPPGLKARLREILRRGVFSQFQGALSVGMANRAYFLAGGIAPDRIFHSPHAIDVSRFKAATATGTSERDARRRQLGIAPDSCVFLFAGKLQGLKRPGDVLAAFRRMAKSDRPSDLVIVGSGALEDRLREEAQGLSAVHFLPFQNQSAMPNLLAMADVIVLPSDSETWGLIINEAQAVGLAAIVSDRVGCAADLVEPDHSGAPGAIFPVGNVAALSQCMTELRDDPALLEQRKRSAVERSGRYTYDAATRGLLEALRVLGVSAR